MRLFPLQEAEILIINELRSLSPSELLAIQAAVHELAIANRPLLGPLPENVVPLYCK
jgi:hypothetical protein